MAREEVCRLDKRPWWKAAEKGAAKRLTAFGIRVLEATQADSWEMCAMEDARPRWQCRCVLLKEDGDD